MNDSWRNIDSKIRLLADDCIIYRKILSIKDVEILQTYLGRLGGRKQNENKSKSNYGTKLHESQGKDPLHYSIGDQRIPKASFCRYLGMIIRSDLSWADHVVYTAFRYAYCKKWK